MFANLKPSILLVDDEEALRSTLAQALAPRCRRLETAASAADAVTALENDPFDLVIADMYMPGASGLELMNISNQAGWDVGIMLISGRTDPQLLISALRLGAADFLVKPIHLATLFEAVDRNFEKLLARREARQARVSLEASLQLRMRDLQRSLHNQRVNHQATLDALVAALDAREHETYAHSFRVTAYTMHLARLAGYPPAMLPQLEQAALLHDIGKIGVPDAVLLKPGKLTPAETAIMREHVILGEQTLSRIGFLRPASGIIRHHHEHFDGRGYPDGLSGDQIPLGARLFALADTLDAITSDRCYSPARTLEEARDEIRRCSGTQFDPQLAALFDSVPDDTWHSLRAQVEQEHTSPIAPELLASSGLHHAPAMVS